MTVPGAARELDDFVAVLEEGARLTAGKLERLLARLGELHQRAIRTGRCAGDRAATEQVAWLYVAAVRALVRDELRHRPVRLAEARARDAHRLLHLRRAELHLELDGIGAFALVGVVVQVGKRFGIFFRAREGRAAVRLERIHRHDPRRDGGGEALRKERTERLVFPRLHIARRPIVEEQRAEEMLVRARDRDWLAQAVSFPDDERELGFVIEALARAVGRRGRFGGLQLAARAA